MVMFVCPLLYMFNFLFCQLLEDLSEHVCLSVCLSVCLLLSVCILYYLLVFLKLIWATSSDERFAFLVAHHCALHCFVSTHFYVVAQLDKIN